MPDSIKVGLGNQIRLIATHYAPVDTCDFTLNWTVVYPGAPYTVAFTDSAAVAVPCTTYWKPTATGTFKILPQSVPYEAGDVRDAPTTDTTYVVVRDDLWGPDNIRYLGAFRVPNGDGSGLPNSEFAESGGRMMAYCPTGEAGDVDDYTGSLYMSGKMHESGGPNVGGKIAQVTIPAPILPSGGSLAALNRASFIQNFTDSFNSPNTSWASYPGNIPKAGDLVYVPAGGSLTYNALIFTFRDTYAVDLDYYAMGRVPADLADFRPQGLWHLGAWSVPSSGGNWTTNHRSWADYLFAAPTSWAESYTGGRWMMAGMGDREAGTNGASRGPALFAFNPQFADRGGTNGTGSAGGDTSKIPVTTILQYVPEVLENTCSATHSSTHNISDYSRTDSWSEGAWLDHAGRSSVIFVGTKCVAGESHYASDGCPGASNGLCNENTGWVCGDDSDDFPPYQTRMWFYDPNDLAQVALGLLDPWEPQPYVVVDMTEYLHSPTTCHASFDGMAYDASSGRIYVSEFVDSTATTRKTPLIHVFDFDEYPEYILDLDLDAPTYVTQGDSFQFVLDWDFQNTASCTFAASDSVVTRISILASDVNTAEAEIAFKTGPGVNTTPPESFTYAFPVGGSYLGVANVRGRVMFTAPAACADTVYTDLQGVWVASP